MDAVLEQAARGGDGRGRLAGTVEPGQMRLFAEPDQLPAGIPPVLLRDQRAGGRFVADAVEVFEGLPVDQTAERPRALRDAACEQTANLRDQSLGELAIDPVRDAPADFGRV